MPKSDVNIIAPENREIIEETVRRTVESAPGFELVELKFYKEFGKLNVEAFIWNKTGVSLNECETVHNILSAELDNLDELFPSEYVLSVSSSGLDRPIIADDDFRRALDTEIEILTDGKKIHGVLERFDAENIVINQGGKPLTIIRKNMTKVQPYVRF